MRLAVIGRTKILLNTIQVLVDAGNVVAVIGTAKASDTDGSVEADFAEIAQTLRAAFFRGNVARASQVIREAAPDLAISMNWPTILNDSDLSLFPGGVLNAHAGDLPRYRGNACPNWAILNGEDKIGLCIHKMMPGEVDAGPIACRRHFKMTDECDIGHVYRWMQRSIPQMFVEVVRAIEGGNITFEQQTEDACKALRCHPRRPSDGKIEWKHDAATITRLIRASTRPFHGAFTSLEGGKEVFIWRGRNEIPKTDICAIPGQVLHADGRGVTIACGSGCVLVTEASFADGSDALPSISGSMRNRLI